MRDSVLQVRGLRVHYHTSRGPVRAVERVSFTLRSGERMGLVGESGSGKSTMSLALLRLIKPPGRIESGEILLDGTDLLSLSDEEMRKVRLARISLVTQGTMNSLNPVMRVKEQIVDGIKTHESGLSKKELGIRVEELLKSVGLRREVERAFAHELSGGMKQRVGIAIAVSLSPDVIIADEPTSALDVVVQRQVMEALEDAQKRIGASILLVGHDIALMAQFTDRVGVMYAGRLVEMGPVRELFKEPLHPYTRLLIASLPDLERKAEFKGIPGLTPNPLNLPGGCAFNLRCPHVMDRCRVETPELKEVGPGRWVSCYLH